VDDFPISPIGNTGITSSNQREFPEIHEESAGLILTVDTAIIPVRLDNCAGTHSSSCNDDSNTNRKEHDEREQKKRCC